MTEIVRDARRRIHEVRMKDVEVSVTKDGKPVENAAVSLRMKKHQFLFGAVCYMLDKHEEQGHGDIFTKEFVKLFNYTMIPYHWSWYEPKYHQYNEPYTSNLIRWADENHLKKKLHALIWHECCPDWLTFEDDITERYTERLTYLMEHFGNNFDFFDVANETTVNDRFDNPVSRWVKQIGPMNMLKFGTRLVRSIKPDAQLIYGDWNVHVDAYYDFLREMRENDIDIDYIGIQSHMHKEMWSQEETMQILERAAAFGWPIHFPECSICSGRPIGETDYSAGGAIHNRWEEKEEDLYLQAENARNFYTLIFSHPSVEALSWFDFTDHRWLGAPAGVVTDTLGIKPVYETLDDLINHEWHSDEDLVTGSSGLCRSRVFCGNYDITVHAGGAPVTVNRDILRERFYAGGGEPVRLTIEL